METVPFSVALVAGGLAVLNPCGFPFLPAFLSFYVGADERSLPRAPNRILQGFGVGAAVAAGFLGLFALIALPITYGARLVADLIPWLGVALGASLAAVGLVAASGRHLSLRMPVRIHARRERRAGAMVAFGAGYGLASLGCTLPVFLALIGASLGTGGPAGSLAVLGAYGAGMTVVLIGLAITAALVRTGLAQILKRLLPHMSRIAGGLLVVAGGYLTYYWLRLELGPSATLADDPIVGLVTRYTARLESLARGEGIAILAVAAAAVAVAAAAGIWQWRRQRISAPADRPPLASLARQEDRR